jgi:hypothetical protein
MYIQIPVKTEVIARNEDICTQGKFEEGKIVTEVTQSWKAAIIKA